MPFSALSTMPPRVIVAGAGVAGLETCLALKALAGDGVNVSLVAPNRYLEYRPVHVHDPLAVHGRARVPVASLARAAGVDVSRDRVVSIDPSLRRVRTAVGYDLWYDALVVAVGAVPQRVPHGAEPFDEDHTAACRFLMDRLRGGHIRSLTFVEPPQPTRAFDLYDLAIEAAVTVRQRRLETQLTFVTVEPAPLAILGLRAAEMLRSTLGAYGVRVVESAHVRSLGAGEIVLAPGARRMATDCVIAAPRLAGPRLEHLPCDVDGFVTVDACGRVPGVAGVFAAGDCTSFPIKHPSLAAQQADAVASAIAADAGLPIAAEPFKPVLRCILPSRLHWYVNAPLTGGCGDATRISALPLWSRSLRFHARHLASRLVGAEDPSMWPDETPKNGRRDGATIRDSVS
jgi:sulfide:quinone oxidoreductase